jgi:hypothetical protein
LGPRAEQRCPRRQQGGSEIKEVAEVGPPFVTPPVDRLQATLEAAELSHRAEGLVSFAAVM